MKTNNNLIGILNNNEFGSIRVLKQNNDFWFVAKDIANILQYNQTNSMKKILDDFDYIEINPQNIENTGFIPVGVTVLESNTNIKRMLLINESGLYHAIFNSKLPKAKQFRKWVTSEVLPAIRKYGVYITDEVLYSPELLEKALEQIKKERQEKLTLQFEVKSLKDTNKQLKKNTKQLTETIQEQEPLVELSKTLLKAKNTITFGCMAKMLKTNGVDIGRNRLTKFLK